MPRSFSIAFTRPYEAWVLDSPGMQRALTIALLLVALAASAQPVVVQGSLDVEWSKGAADCATSMAPALQIHRYEPRTFIIREDLCKHFEAPFLYLLIGTEKALLVDTGAVADPQLMPVARTVMALVRTEAGVELPLVVVHSHGHRDHIAGDQQFASLDSVTLVAAEVDSIRRFFALDKSSSGTARLDLGARVVHVIPAPGHQRAHLVFYDERTALLLTGDFLLPGRLLVEDRDAYLRSALRVADFVKDRPVSHILGAHIELRSDRGELVEIGSHYHPKERRLELRKDVLFELAPALEAFEGSVARHPDFVIMNR